MPHLIFTKIIATLGPVSAVDPMLTRLVQAGVDVFRLNFSHGKLDVHAAALAAVRDVSKKLEKPLAILGDLCGPKIRLGDVAEESSIEVGGSLVIQRDPIPGTAARVSTNYPRIVDEVEVGHRVLVEDGMVRFVVTGKSGGELTCRCTTGGKLSTRKGVNLPDTALTIEGLTDYDRECVTWAAEHGVDYLAMSFVRRGADMVKLRNLLSGAGAGIKLIAKVERPEAVAYIDEVIEASDAIMVARGDLGVEIDLAEVPGIQKRIIQRCREATRPVIVATQMLQSMIEQPTPTRAEVSDVANAVYDGADAVMLSGETSVGKFPSIAVSMMSHVTEVAEADIRKNHKAMLWDTPAIAETATSVTEQDKALARGAWQMAQHLRAKAVVVWTEHGTTGRMFSKLRFAIPLIAVSSDERVVRQMAMFYGVTPMRMESPRSLSDLVPRVQRLLMDKNMACVGDTILVVGRTRLGQRGQSNAIMVHRIERFID
jgi:pyruvate kinase